MTEEQIDKLAQSTHLKVDALVQGFLAGSADPDGTITGDALAAIWSGLVAAIAEFSRASFAGRDVDAIADAIREGVVEWLDEEAGQ